MAASGADIKGKCMEINRIATLGDVEKMEQWVSGQYEKDEKPTEMTYRILILWTLDSMRRVLKGKVK